MTMLTTNQVAQALGLSRRAVNDAIRRGSLPATKDGRDYKVDPEHVVTYAATRRGGSGRQRDPRSQRLHVVGISSEAGAKIRTSARHLGLTLPRYIEALQELYDRAAIRSTKGDVAATAELVDLELIRAVDPGWEAFAEAYGNGLEARSADADR